MQLSKEQCKQIIRNAYAIQTAARNTLARLPPDAAAAHLIMMATAAIEPEPEPYHFLDDLDHPYWAAVAVAGHAYRLGHSVLVGEYLLRRAQEHHVLPRQPTDTTYKRLADRAMNAMLKCWEDRTKAGAVPELHAAYKKLDALLGVLHDVVRDDQRAAMGLKITPGAINLNVVRLADVEYPQAV